MAHLSSYQKWLLAVIAWVLVGFGQPAWHWLIGLIAGVVGYAIFFRVILEIPTAWRRFWIGTAWFTAIEITQLSWMVSHPYSYIYGVLIVFSFLVALQFGVLCLFIQPKAFNRLIMLAGIASLWTIMEWSRLFILIRLLMEPCRHGLDRSYLSVAASLAVGGFWPFLLGDVGEPVSAAGLDLANEGRANAPAPLLCLVSLCLWSCSL